MREDRTFGQLLAEMMNQRFVRNSVKTVAPNTSVEVALRQRKMRGDFRNRLMKSVVETRELRGRWENRLRGCNKFQSLRNMERGEVCCGPQMMQDLRSNDLMFAKIRSAVNDAVPNRDWSVITMFAYCRSERVQGVTLRFVNAVALH